MDNVSKTPAEIHAGLMAAKDVTRTANISRAHLYAMVSRHQFPAPALRCGSRFTRWKASDVHTWLANPQGWIETNTSRVQA